MKSIFEGTGVALVTPFKDDKIDFDSLGKLIDAGIDGGVKAFVALGTTGEGVSVSTDERIEIIKFCKAAIGQKAKLIVGTGNNNFSTCYENTRLAKELGADGALVVTPYYNKTTQFGLIKYYQELSKLKFPMIMYNVPSRTGLMLELSTIGAIINANDWVYGIKESTSDASRICKLCALCKDKISVYSGEDALNHLFYTQGGSGAISVTANAFPDKVQKIFELCKEGNFSDALSLQHKLAQIDEALFFETNPIPIKYMLSQKGICSPDVRLPLVQMSEEGKSKLNRNVRLFEQTETEKTISTPVKVK